MNTLPFAALLLAALALALTPPAEAQKAGNYMGQKKGRKGRMKGRQSPPPASQEKVSEDSNPEAVAAFSPMMAKLEQMRARGFMATGLVAVYPENADCPKGTSDFASPTRSDGSRRSRRFYQGLHGGYDIPAAEGTPLLAIADGTVVHIHEGASIGGLALILQHAPADTGPGVWTYTEYKHLRELPDLDIGQRVAMGQKIALAGKTGTQGGHYGAQGFSHLHLTAFFSKLGEFKIRRMLVPVEGQWLDPLALFKKSPPLDSPTLSGLPAAEKRVSIPYKTSDGRIVPAGSRVVWPFVCRSR
jgi:murein DD-endopeptidase MepM/ murein hydrolase activator NlpD